MIVTDSFYLELLNNMYDGIYFLDRDRRMTYWNKGAEKIAGYRSDELIGSRCCDNILVHVDKEGTSLCDRRYPCEKE